MGTGDQIRERVDRCVGRQERLRLEDTKNTAVIEETRVTRQELVLKETCKRWETYQRGRGAHRESWITRQTTKNIASQESAKKRSAAHPCVTRRPLKRRDTENRRGTQGVQETQESETARRNEEVGTALEQLTICDRKDEKSEKDAETTTEELEESQSEEDSATDPKSQGETKDLEQKDRPSEEPLYPIVQTWSNLLFNPDPRAFHIPKNQVPVESRGKKA